MSASLCISQTNCSPSYIYFTTLLYWRVRNHEGICEGTLIYLHDRKSIHKAVVLVQSLHQSTFDMDRHLYKCCLWQKLCYFCYSQWGYYVLLYFNLDLNPLRVKLFTGFVAVISTLFPHIISIITHQDSAFWTSIHIAILFICDQIQHWTLFFKDNFAFSFNNTNSFLQFLSQLWACLGYFQNANYPPQPTTTVAMYVMLVTRPCSNIKFTNINLSFVYKLRSMCTCPTCKQNWKISVMRIDNNVADHHYVFYSIGICHTCIIFTFKMS